MERDTLTGYLVFQDFIREAGKLIKNNPEQKEYLLISTDISNFKYINHLYGFTAGNMLIVAMFDKIMSANPGAVYVCRPYSDHFLGIFERTYQVEEHKRLLRKVQEEFIAENKPLFPKVSLHLNTGIYFMSDGEEEITAAVDKANIARRSVKGNYSVSCATYSDQIRKTKEVNDKVIPIFDEALEQGTIQVYLQPKISVKDGRVVGAEALTRLLDENGNVIPPDVFIPVLESSSKIMNLDWYVMKYIFATIRKWIDDGCEVYPISINLSKIHFYHDNLVKEIIEVFNKYRIPSSYIEFEVTESVFFEESELIIKKIQQLRAYGFKVSVDDFGAGYSSLNLLGILPVDIIKLDKGFVKTSLENQKGKDIIKGLIHILNEIDMGIVCEGIETKEEETIVNDYGCDSMQGFLYDRPIPIKDFELKYVNK